MEPGVTLRVIGPENLREVVKLSDTLSDSQKNCVASNAVSVAQAHFSDTAWFRAVYLGNEAIGFVMVDTLATDVPEADQPAVMLWRFMIGKPWQRSGYGRQALDQVIETFRARGVRTLYTSCVMEEPEGPYGFYIGYGFQDTGIMDDDEEVLRLDLAAEREDTVVAPASGPRFLPMARRIALVTVWTDDIEPMKRFYAGVLGFAIEKDLGGYVEFESPGVRFAVCRRDVMRDVFGEASREFSEPAGGQRFELAFPCEEPADVDKSYDALLARGAAGVAPPRDTPWGQRAALFADPDGNVHEIFAGLAD